MVNIRYTMAMHSRFFSWLIPVKVHHPDAFRITAITSVSEFDDPEQLPLELRFVLKKDPKRAQDIRALLESGYGIGIRTVEETPEAVLKAIDHISHLTQENTVIPWLPRLLRDGDMPTFSELELRTAERAGVALYEQARLILERRYEFKKIVLIDLRNQGVREEHRRIALELDEVLYPYALDYIVHRVLFDNAHTRTEVAQTIIKALLIVGPVAHALEHVAHGIGKIFAASADDLLGETAELFALRGSGFTWRQLIKRSRILVPVFVLATYGAFSVERFIEAGQLGIAGAIFGVSAVALSLTTALQSIKLYHDSFVKLKRMGKLRVQEQRLWRLAFTQDFSNPARLGLCIGAAMAPFTAAMVFLLAPQWTHNGWILAVLGSVESLVAGATVIGAKYLHAAWFRRRMRAALRVS